MPTTQDHIAEIGRLTKERDAAQGNADENYRRLMAERERCAKIASDRASMWAKKNEANGDEPSLCGMPLQEECEDIAAAIRRG
jgi:hypothetical protein